MAKIKRNVEKQVRRNDTEILKSQGHQPVDVS